MDNNILNTSNKCYYFDSKVYVEFNNLWMKIIFINNNSILTN